MIKELQIKNFALIKDLSLKFDKGFNVLIGETGAGKSIILKSIAFILGEKANKSSIRFGENHIIVTALFEDYSQKTIEILKNWGFDDEGVLIIHRKYTIDGKNECRINGNLITLTMLKELSETLVDSTSQHENQLLLKTNNHLSMLDNYKTNLTFNLKNEISSLYNQFKSLDKKINELGGDKTLRQYKIEILNHQIKEIEEANLKPNEDIEIAKRLDLIRNYGKICENLKDANSLLDESSNSVIYQLNQAIKSLENASKYTNDFENIIVRMNTSLFELQDINQTILSFLNDINYSEYELEQLDERLDLIKSLKKKYCSNINATIDDLLKSLEDAKEECSKLENADEEILKLTKDKESVLKNLMEKSINLSQTRRKIALELEDKITKELAFLGMKNTRFKVYFKNNIENEHIKEEDFSSNGLDKIEFMFSANLGQELQSLSKTISGGEMSRFMLALKNIITANDDIQTLIFDEIDAGISGEIGSAVGERIASLAQNKQIICITHLPQVAVMADKYFYISKETIDNQTQTKSQVINPEEVYKFISRMSGGNFESEISVAHARELKNWADDYKNKLNV